MQTMTAAASKRESICTFEGLRRTDTLSFTFFNSTFVRVVFALPQGRKHWHALEIGVAAHCRGAHFGIVRLTEMRITLFEFAKTAFFEVG